MSDINAPEPPIEPIQTSWQLQVGSGDTRYPWSLTLELWAPYVMPTEAEITEAIISSVLKSTGIRLAVPHIDA